MLLPAISCQRCSVLTGRSMRASICLSAIPYKLLVGFFQNSQLRCSWTDYILWSKVKVTARTNALFQWRYDDRRFTIDHSLVYLWQEAARSF